jgi:hypothetical protein
MPGSGGSFAAALDGGRCDAGADSAEPCGAEQLTIIVIAADSIIAAAVTALLLNIAHLDRGSGNTPGKSAR